MKQELLTKSALIQMSSINTCVSDFYISTLIADMLVKHCKNIISYLLGAVDSASVSIK